MHTSLKDFPKRTPKIFGTEGNQLKMDSGVINRCYGRFCWNSVFFCNFNRPRVFSFVSLSYHIGLIHKKKEADRTTRYHPVVSSDIVPGLSNRVKVTFMKFPEQCTNFTNLTFFPSPHQDWNTNLCIKLACQHSGGVAGISRPFRIKK